MTQPQTFSLIHETTSPIVGEPPYPGLLLLHGRGSNELDLLPLGHELDPRVFVISPRAPFMVGPDAYIWYDLEAPIVGVPSNEDIRRSVDLVRDLMIQAIEAYEIDADRFFVGGFSMGGAMTAATVLMYPELVAGALILSGYVPAYSNLPWRPDDAVGKPIFQAHGTLDDVLEIQFGRMSRDFLLQTPVSLTYKEYPIAHSIAPEELADASTWLRGLLDLG